ncbi:MAG: winged helix-turn-helix domain-containing protein [Promethearchaeia archaeon]
MEENEPKLEDLKKNISFGIKYWLCFDKKNILGKGWAKLLRNINREDVTSLTEAAKKCGYSYKYAWNILKRIEKRTGHSPVITGKGGAGGGGFIKLNEWGKIILNIFLELDTEVNRMEKKIRSSILKNE